MIILGLGSNIGDRLWHLRLALRNLRSLENIKITQVSPVYESDALLPENPKTDWNLPYLNLAVSCKSKLPPDILLEKIKNIELQMGRREHLHWAPRTIDIDILVWDDKVYQSNALQIPHEDLLNRPFAMWPLCDLIPDWHYRGGQTAQEIIKPWGSRFDGKAPFHTRQIAHRVDTPQMVGVLNITPDSFSDGGKYEKIDATVKQAKHLFKTGADIIDIGAESTRPGAANIVTPAEEWQRLDPALEAIIDIWKDIGFKPKISIDSRNPSTARQALTKHKIDWLNDQTGFDNPEMRKIAIESAVKLIVMHHLCIPENRGVLLPFEKDPVLGVYQWAEKRIAELLAMGIDKDRVILDPGIGFGKHAEQSFIIIKEIAKFKDLGLPLLVGHSRKSFMNQFTNLPFAERDLETAVISNFLATQQIDYLRVHNVAAQMRALKINKALYGD
jgi:2-amino-4-hydroxy-6-hydroxymethyldihydropteridine diphosphokinase/dihydropteroate synthase